MVPSDDRLNSKFSIICFVSFVVSGGAIEEKNRRRVGDHNSPRLIPMLSGRGFITTHTLLSLPLKACPHVYKGNLLPGHARLRCRDVMT